MEVTELTLTEKDWLAPQTNKGWKSILRVDNVMLFYRFNPTLEDLYDVKYANALTQEVYKERRADLEDMQSIFSKILCGWYMKRVNEVFLKQYRSERGNLSSQKDEREFLRYIEWKLYQKVLSPWRGIYVFKVPGMPTNVDDALEWCAHAPEVEIFMLWGDVYAKAKKIKYEEI